MAAAAVTLVIDGSFSAAHALIDRCCDARWLAAARRATLRAQASQEPDARRLLHERLQVIEDLAIEARAGRTPAERHGSALRLTIPGERAEAAVVRDLARWGTGELLASAFVIEEGVDASLDRTGHW
jgi:hypothetical protein